MNLSVFLRTTAPTLQYSGCELLQKSDTKTSSFGHFTFFRIDNHSVSVLSDKQAMPNLQYVGGLHQTPATYLPQLTPQLTPVLGMPSTIAVPDSMSAPWPVSKDTPPSSSDGVLLRPSDNGNGYRLVQRAGLVVLF